MDIASSSSSSWPIQTGGHWRPKGGQIQRESAVSLLDSLASYQRWLPPLLLLLFPAHSGYGNADGYKMSLEARFYYTYTHIQGRGTIGDEMEEMEKDRDRARRYGVAKSGRVVNACRLWDVGRKTAFVV